MAAGADAPAAASDPEGTKSLIVGGTTNCKDSPGLLRQEQTTFRARATSPVVARHLSLLISHSQYHFKAGMLRGC